MENIEIIYEDDNLLAVNKPAGIVVFPEGKYQGKTLIDCLIEERPKLKKVGSPPRYGVVHRLDKDTSGILLIAKNDKSMEFLQKQFQERKVFKLYTALVVGNLENEQGTIETLIGRSPKDRKKQKAYSALEAKKGLRTAVTKYRVLQKFENYGLIEVEIKTGRKHQIRCHFNYLSHPLAGDKIYGFKNQSCPPSLKRHFLHAGHLKIKLLNDKILALNSELPEDLEKALNEIN
ncbi:RluA family pseudouridine synthase [Candidatus Parcubacteria bacterium]|nr:RluA family pseudouridine synthase [Candidatus Parcubacteria bacterium]